MSSSAIHLAKISRFVERQSFYQCREKPAIEIFIKSLQSSSLTFCLSIEILPLSLYVLRNTELLTF